MFISMINNVRNQVGGFMTLLEKQKQQLTVGTVIGGNRWNGTKWRILEVGADYVTIARICRKGWFSKEEELCYHQDRTFVSLAKEGYDIIS